MPTIKDVAHTAGCSTATVSRALANPEKVTEKTRHRVAQAIAKVGYSPNVAARNLRRSESRTILILLPDISNPFFSQIINGLEEVAQRAGYQVLVGDCDHDASRTQAYFDLLPTNQADGIILLTSEVPLSLVKPLHQSSAFPVVVACEYFEGISLPTIFIDNHQAAARATEYLISLGHQHIATISGPMGNPICKDRIRGFRDELQRSGLSANPEWFVEGDFTFRTGYQQAKRLLSNASSRRPTAIFCHSDEMAIGALKAASELNISVPSDLSVVGFDNIDFSEYCEPELTTIS
ncbi:MAG: LacI family DNA-binding transcriptional regulator, partial [Natronospirillum sp.]